ncbi:MAG: hypothetical protein LBS28_02035 [Streptococcaceae bacterium]|nr:hypothetical protein [Streptococcaceae bacterium]
MVFSCLLNRKQGLSKHRSIAFFILIPFKKLHKKELNSKQKKGNRMILKIRILIEHVNRLIKRFKMFKYRYQNKQRKYFLKFSLVYGLFNYNLKF